MKYQLAEEPIKDERESFISHPMSNVSSNDMVEQEPPYKKQQEVNSSIPHSSIGYRADIDGLRTISIIVVVFHHVWNKTFAGGFMGVDIFFVISGYLISKIIFKELRKEQQFSYSKFYSRRIRRIFPALITMLIYSFYLYQQCLSVEQLKNGARQFIAACLMGVNILMMYKDYHHDESGNYVQVLWTLGIEEQFYLFWPLFVTKLWKLPMEKGLIAIGIAIFILHHMYYNGDWNSFGIHLYMLPFWQLLVGCFVAYYQQKKLQREQNSQKTIFKMNELVRQETLWERTKSTKGIISSIAIILIMLSLAKQDNYNKSVYWTWTAIFGTAVFIHCGKGIFNDLILGNRVTIFIGKISYSWYLLHVPLLRFCNFFSPIYYLNVLTGFILAVLCTYGIQNNIRFSKSKYVIPGLVATMGFLLIVFITVYLFPQAWALQKNP